MCPQLNQKTCRLSTYIPHTITLQTLQEQEFPALMSFAAISRLTCTFPSHFADGLSQKHGQCLSIGAWHLFRLSEHTFRSLDSWTQCSDVFDLHCRGVCGVSLSGAPERDELMYVDGHVKDGIAFGDVVVGFIFVAVIKCVL